MLTIMLIQLCIRSKRRAVFLLRLTTTSSTLEETHQKIQWFWLPFLPGRPFIEICQNFNDFELKSSILQSPHPQVTYESWGCSFLSINPAFINWLKLIVMLCMLAIRAKLFLYTLKKIITLTRKTSLKNLLSSLLGISSKWPPSLSSVRLQKKE